MSVVDPNAFELLEAISKILLDPKNSKDPRAYLPHIKQHIDELYLKEFQQQQQTTTKKTSSPSGSSEGKDDESSSGETPKAADGTFLVSSLRSSSSALRTLETKIRFAKLNASPEELLKCIPSLPAVSKEVDMMQAVLERVVPTVYSGGGASRFEFNIAKGADPQQPNYFGRCPPNIPPLLDVFNAVDYKNYYVCAECGRGVNHWNLKSHMDNNHGGVMMDTTEMTGEWVFQQCSQFPLLVAPIHAYTLETPLCYEGNRSMREVRGQNRCPFDNPQPNEVLFAEKYWAFEKHLFDALLSLPNESCTVYRAVNFNVSSNIYEEGNIVTWNQVSSTSADPRVVKGFLDSGSGGEVKGTIFIIHTKRGKSIQPYSQYPEEKEVLLMANTQMRVLAKVGNGVKDLVACALRCDLAKVAIIEMQEIELERWVDVKTVLFREEILRVKKFLDYIATVHDNLEWQDWCEDVSDPVTLRPLDGWGYLPLTHWPEHESVDAVFGMQQVLELDMSTGVWNVILHRISGDDLLTTHSRFVLHLFENVLPEQAPSFSTEETADAHFTIPLMLRAMRAVMNKLRVYTPNEIIEFFSNLTLEGKAGLLLGGIHEEMWSADVIKPVLEEVLTNKPLAARLLCYIATFPVLPSMTILSLFPLDVYNIEDEMNCISPIHVATLHGHKAILEYVPKEFLEAKDNFGRTPLYIAAQSNRLEVVQYLVEVCPKLIKVGDTANRTPCLVAAEKGHLAVVTHIANIDPSVLQIKNDNNSHAVRVACQEGHLDIVKFAVGKAPKTVDGSLLWAACENGQLDVVQFLCTLKPDLVDYKNPDNKESSLYIAAFYGYFEVVKYLLSVKNTILDVVTEAQETILHAACTGGNLDMVRYIHTLRPEMIHKVTTDGDTVMHYACQKNVDIAKFLSETVPELLDKVNTANETPLFAACEKGKMNIVSFLYERNSQQLTLRNVDNETILHKAAREGKLNVVKFVLSACSDETRREMLAIRSTDDESCLDCALSSGEDSVVEEIDPDRYNALVALRKAEEDEVAKLTKAHGNHAMIVVRLQSAPLTSVCSLRVDYATNHITYFGYSTAGIPTLAYRAKNKTQKPKVYFEVTLVQLCPGTSEQCLGWANKSFEKTEIATNDSGLGDDEFSWALNTTRNVKVHNEKEIKLVVDSTKWAAGDVVGFALEIKTTTNTKTPSSAVWKVSKNGSFDAPYGEVFSGIPCEGLFPAWSGERCVIGINMKGPFLHQPPDDTYVPIAA